MQILGTHGKMKMRDCWYFNAAEMAILLCCSFNTCLQMSICGRSERALVKPLAAVHGSVLSTQRWVFLSCSSWVRFYFPPRQLFSPVYAPFRIHLPSSSFKFYFYSNSHAFVLGALFEKPLSFSTKCQLMVLSYSFILMDIYFRCKVPLSGVKFPCVSFCCVSWCIRRSRAQLLYFMWMVVLSVGRTFPSEWALSGWVQDTQNQDDLFSISGFSMILNVQSENLWKSLPILICWLLFLEMIFFPCPSAILCLDTPG